MRGWRNKKLSCVYISVKEGNHKVRVVGVFVFDPFKEFLSAILLIVIEVIPRLGNPIFPMLNSPSVS